MGSLEQKYTKIDSINHYDYLNLVGSGKAVEDFDEVVSTNPAVLAESAAEILELFGTEAEIDGQKVICTPEVEMAFLMQGNRSSIVRCFLASLGKEPCNNAIFVADESEDGYYPWLMFDLYSEQGAVFDDHGFEITKQDKLDICYETLYMLHERYADMLCEYLDSIDIINLTNGQYSGKEPGFYYSFRFTDAISKKKRLDYPVYAEKPSEALKQAALSYGCKYLFLDRPIRIVDVKVGVEGSNEEEATLPKEDFVPLLNYLKTYTLESNIVSTIVDKLFDMVTQDQSGGVIKE